MSRLVPILFLVVAPTLSGCLASATTDAPATLDDVSWVRGDDRILSVDVGGPEEVVDSYGRSVPAYTMDVDVDGDWLETFWVDRDGMIVRQIRCSVHLESGCNRLDVEYAAAGLPNPYGWLWAKHFMNTSVMEWQVGRQTLSVAIHVQGDDEAGTRSLTFSFPGLLLEDVPYLLPSGTYVYRTGIPWPESRAAPPVGFRVWDRVALESGPDLEEIGPWSRSKTGPPAATGEWIPGGDKRVIGHITPDAVIASVRQEDPEVDDLLTEDAACVAQYSEVPPEPTDLPMGVVHPMQVKYRYLIGISDGERHRQVDARATVTGEGLLTTWDVFVSPMSTAPKVACGTFQPAPNAMALGAARPALDEALQLDAARQTYGFSRMVNLPGTIEEGEDPGTFRKSVVPAAEYEDCGGSCSIITAFAESSPQECSWLRFRIPPSHLDQLDEDLSGTEIAC